MDDQHNAKRKYFVRLQDLRDFFRAELQANTSSNHSGGMIISHAMGEYNGESDGRKYNNDDSYAAIKLPATNFVSQSPVGYYDDSLQKRNASQQQHMYWDPDATRCLIRLRGERDVDFETNNGRKGQMWVEISDRMAELGYDFGVDKVSKKWHNIMMTYNKNVKKKERTGNVNWEYFEDLDAFFRNRCSPMMVLAGGGGDAAQPLDASDDSYDPVDFGMLATAAAAAAASTSAVTVMPRPAIRATDNVSPLLVPIVPAKRKASKGLEQPLQLTKRVQLVRVASLKSDDWQQPVELKPQTAAGDTKPLMAAAVESAANGAAFKRGMMAGTMFGGDIDEDGRDADADSNAETLWMREYFQKKLELERERIKNEQDRHRDYMNFQKMTLMLQEKMEKNKVEALRSLTDAINRLV